MNKVLLIVMIMILVIIVVSCKDQIINDNNENTELAVEDVDDLRLKIGVMLEYSPYIISSNEELTGPYIDIVKKSLDNLGYEYEIVGLPWSRMVTAIKTGDIDMALPFFYKSEREEFLYYSKEAIGFSRIDLIGLKSKGIKFVGDYTSLSDYRVGVVQDYFYSSEFEQLVKDGTIKTDVAISTDDNIELLLLERVDLIVEDYTVVKEYIRENKVDEALTFYEPSITSDLSYMVYRKSDELSELIKDIDTELRRMKNDESLYEIYSNYGMNYYGDALKALENPMVSFHTDKPLTIGILGDTKPYAFYENNELTGFGVEFITDVLSRNSIEYELINIPFSRMLEELKSGSLDIGTDLYLKPEREEYLNYPQLPYAAYPTVIFKKVKTDFTFTGDLDELKPYTIGYVRGYSIGPLDEYKESADYNFVVTDTPEQNVENLANERVDLIIDIKSTGENIVAEMNLSDGIESVEPAVYYDYSYIVFSKKNNLESLIPVYESTVLEMFNDGTMKELAEKYGLPYLEFNEFRDWGFDCCDENKVYDNIK